MSSIGISFYPHSHLANNVETALPVTDTSLSGPPDILRQKDVGTHTSDLLKAREHGGYEGERRLAGLVNASLANKHNGLHLSPDQPEGDIFQYETRGDNQEHSHQPFAKLSIEVKKHGPAEYDILRITHQPVSGDAISMTLPQSESIKADIPSSPSRLLKLPDELLLNVVKHTLIPGRGLPLAVRLVNKHLGGIATKDFLSYRQKFLKQYGHILSDAGYDRNARNYFFRLAHVEKQFALTYGPTLHDEAGYNGFSINKLAELSQAERNFARANGKWLHDNAGYDGASLNELAQHPDRLAFVQLHGKTLHESGYDGFSINDLAGLGPAEQDIVLAHCKALYEVGHDPFSINDLAGAPEAERDFVLAYGKALHEVGYNGGSINELARLNDDEQQFARDYGQTLHEAGYNGFDINDLAVQPTAKRDFVVTHGKTLHEVGYGGEGINALVNWFNPTAQKFAQQYGKWLYDNAGYYGSDISQLGTMSAAEQQFAWDDGPTLHKSGHDGNSINEFARLNNDQQTFVRDHSETLHKAGYNGESINELAGRPKAELDFALKYGQWLHDKAGHDGRDTNALAQNSDVQDFILAHGETLYGMGGYDVQEMEGLGRQARDHQEVALARLDIKEFLEPDVPLDH